MRNLKSFCAKQIREATGVSGAVWQSRFHDRAIRNEFQYQQAIEYVHQNPVKAGLVQSDESYEFSSARAYAGWTDVALEIDAPDGSRLGP
jgi:REP element-mobilizing transposase RayT